MKEEKHQDVWLIRIEHFCEICQDITSRHIKDFQFNLSIEKEKCCVVCEENAHVTTNCILNMKKKPTYHKIYQTKPIEQNQQSRGNCQNDNYNCQGSYNGHGKFNINDGGRGRRPNFFICFKEDHISLDYPLKDKVSLKFCRRWEVDDHSL